MKTVIILSFLVNDHGAAHLAVYETKLDNCYQAELAALDQAWVDYIDTGKADKVSIKSSE
ncbi:MAG: hypothetical protein ACI9WC_001348 [Arenicella sp.]|jgi:hypothetical protein